MASDLDLRRIAFIGFGEAGSILGADLAATGRVVVTYDILLDDPARRASMLEKARRLAVEPVNSLREAIQGADLVISAVTATSAAEVAAQAAKTLRPGQIFLDINSVSPATKLTNARAVEGRAGTGADGARPVEGGGAGAGAHGLAGAGPHDAQPVASGRAVEGVRPGEGAGADYVEAAVMAPVPPQRLKVPMLLGGRRAVELAQALQRLGMNTTAIADRIGVASAVKMCRSVVIKGLEALTLECVLAARSFGAEQEVLASLHGTFPHMGWKESLPDYLVSRVAEHGRRRAAEMREVARTLQDAGLEPTMALATAARQDWLIDTMAAHGLSYPHGQPFSWRWLADAVLQPGSASPQGRNAAPGDSQARNAASADSQARNAAPDDSQARNAAPAGSQARNAG